MAQVWISIGHGCWKSPTLFDNGAVANGTTEYAECKIIGEAVVREMEKRYGFQVGLVPVGMTLPVRTKWVNDNILNDKLLIELHMNGAGDASANGAELFYYDGFDIMRALGEKFLDEFCKKTEIKKRAVKSDRLSQHKRLGIIRDTKPMALLIELGFISNSLDLEKVRSKATLGICSMLALHYNLKEMTIDIPKISPDYINAVKWCVEKGYMTQFMNPQEIIATPAAEASLHKAGVITRLTGRGITKERWALILQRLLTKE